MTEERERGGSTFQGWRPWLWWLLPAALVLLLLVLVVQPRDWPSWAGDEATYLMAAQSLALDFDYRYSVEDFERFVATFGRAPEGLILQSPDDGETLLYAKPIFYPAFVAPFVATLGLRGALLANLLLLAVLTAVAARRLAPVLGSAAPLWVTLLVVGSVMIGQLFWAHADLFLAAFTGIGLALALDPRIGPEGRHVTAWSQLGVALLVVVVVSRPLYAPILLPVVLLAIGRSRSLLRLFAPALALLLVTVVGNQLLRGSWTSYGGERQGFYEYTGFPEIDGADWRQRVAERGTNSWTGRNLLPFPFDLRQFVWNVVYLLAGRHVGLIPYYPALLLCLLLLRPGDVRITLLLAIALSVTAFLVVRPINFWGGGGALANRYFLPLYPACWFLIGARPRAWQAGAVLLVGALFLGPIWRDPAMFLRTPEGRYAWVSPIAQRWLPYETTQNQLKPSGRDDFLHQGLWVKPLAPGIAPDEDEGWMAWSSERRGELLFGREQPILRIELCSRAELLEPVGAEVLGEEDTDGLRCWRLDPGRPRAKHPMWWTQKDLWLYRLDLRPTGVGPVEVRLRPIELDPATAS